MRVTYDCLEADYVFLLCDGAHGCLDEKKHALLKVVNRTEYLVHALSTSGESLFCFSPMHPDTIDHEQRFVCFALT